MIKNQITYKDINIVYEDNKVIVAIKPQNIPSQEDSSHDIDMLNLIKEYRISNENKEGNAFVGLVHRLDRPTGGLMVFAKNSKAANKLTSQILQGYLEKEYLAVVWGVPDKNKARLTNYLIKDEKNNIVRVGQSADKYAKEAILDYEVLAISEERVFSLIKIKLLTGRSHQIRVQMANIGNPLFGDFKYGEKENKILEGRNVNLALYATDLKFICLNTAQKLLFRVYPPNEQIPWSYFNIHSFLNILDYNK